MDPELFKDFNFSLLNDPTFSEASVREDLIAPLIKYLGYFNSGTTEIIRDHGLKHPFVSIGSTRKRVTVIPDYLLKVNGRPAWILEAKSPTEAITDNKHTEQAYCYAIHPEIRVNYFALCNGREFVLYNISNPKPLFQLPLIAIDPSKQFIKEVLAPSNVFTVPQLQMSKDLGLHVKRIGFHSSDSIFIIGIKLMMIFKYSDNHFSFPAPVGTHEDTYLGSFDFDLDRVLQLKPLIGDAEFAKLTESSKNETIQFFLRDEIEVSMRVSLPVKEVLVENANEIYLPMLVNEFVIT